MNNHLTIPPLFIYLICGLETSFSSLPLTSFGLPHYHNMEIINIHGGDQPSLSVIQSLILSTSFNEP